MSWPLCDMCESKRSSCNLNPKIVLLDFSKRGTFLWNMSPLRQHCPLPSCWSLLITNNPKCFLLVSCSKKQLKRRTHLLWRNLRALLLQTMAYVSSWTNWSWIDGKTEDRLIYEANHVPQVRKWRDTELLGHASLLTLFEIRVSCSTEVCWGLRTHHTQYL